MKITLVGSLLNNKYPQPPLGLISLASILKKNNHKVNLIDQNIENFKNDDSDIYGINVLSASYENVRNLIDNIRSNSKTSRIILGGAHCSALPEKTFIDLKPDALVIGEGEISILRCLEENGIIHSDKIVDMESLPIPEYDLLKFNKYHVHPPHGKKQPFIPMVTSRGCPFQCIFCDKSTFGYKYRVYSALRTYEEIVYLIHKYGAKEICFYDDVFTLNKQRIYDICDMILRNNIKIIWSCETRVDLVDKDLLVHMKKAGCYSISYGVESGNQKILEYLSKGIEYWQVYKAFNDTTDIGIDTVGYFMFVPGMDDIKSINETIDLAKRLDIDYVQFSKMIALAGSKIYEGQTNNNSYATFGGSNKDIIDIMQSKAYKNYYLNPHYIMKRLRKSFKSFDDFKITLKGIKMLYGG